jgi:hypothetical protein
MKWIGQHVWGFISRFRNDVYLEDISAGTIESGSNLGLDANNKIVKENFRSGGGGGNGEASKVRLPVRFKEAVSKGDPVYIDGYNYGQGTVEVLKAKALISAGTMPSFGLADADYSLNDDGYVITIGNLQNINTQSFNEGDTLYVASTGSLTNIKPSSETNLIQNVGVVTRAQQNTGQIEVVATGRSNDTPNLDHNNIFIGNINDKTHSDSLYNAIYGVGNVAVSGDLNLSGGNLTSASGDLILTSGVIELGHASDTTISRKSAGVIEVEGKEVPTLHSGGGLTLLGGIELGHASDTTLSRSSPGTLQVEGKEVVTLNKVRQAFNMNFYDNINSSEHWLSWRDQYESSSIIGDSVDTEMVCPANGRVVAIMGKFGSINYNTTRTYTVYKQTSGYPSSVEVEGTTVTSSDDYDRFIWYFDDDQHFDAGDVLKISVKDSSNGTGTTGIYMVTVVIEWDYTEMGRTDSGKIY